MNSTFKVVFNKARGALMVVNEVTSSVQGKGTKTVVAAAVAAMIAGVSGSAMATETDTEIKATDTALKATFTKAEKQDDVASSLIGTSGDKLVLKNVTNKGMYAAGSLDLTASSKDNVVTLKNGSVSNFSGKVTSADHFGAVVTATTGTLKIDNVTFENNKFDEVKTGEQKHNGARGIIRAAGANLEVAKSTFAGNEAVLGGAINVWSNGENTVKITDSTFTGNATKSHGGAVYITGSEVKTTIADSTFSKNTSGKQGGALQLAGAGETTITNTTFSENAAGTFGGAINATNTQVVAKNVNFEGNKAVGDDGHGGALFLNGNTASYTQAGGKFVGNSAKKNGGAIRVQDGADLALTNVVFDGNTAANGGAVDTFNAGDVKFTDTTFTNNQAGGWGGALRINGGNVTIAVTEGKSLVYEGNRAGTNAEAAAKNYEKQGDFMYLNGASDRAAFELAGDLTIKDSIVSNHGTIEKTGKGTLTTADMTGFVGKLDVKEGKMVIEGGIAEYDIAAQIGVNKGTSGAVELDPTTVTVGQDGEPFAKAELAMGAVQANHAINFDVNVGSTLTMQSLTVGTKEYAQRTEAKADPAKATYVGAVNITGDATVTEGVTVAAGTADKAAVLTQTSGNLTAKSLTVAAAVEKDQKVTAQAGTFNQTDGTLTVDTLTNGGTMTVNGTVVTNADSVNTGAINSYKSKNGSLTIAGGTFTNDGKMTFKKITVEDGATLKTGVNLDGKASFVVFETLDLQKGSTLNINALNAKSKDDGKADILKFTEGTVNLNGGALQVAGEAFTGKVALDAGATANIDGDYTFEQVNNGGKATVGGTLTVTDSFTAGDFTVADNGTLVLTSKAAGLKIADGIATKNSNLTNNGTITFTDAAGEFASLDKVAAVKNALVSSGNGLIVFGDKVTIKAEEVNKVLKDGKVKASDVANLAGVELEQFKDATVTGVDAALSGSFGKVELAAGQTALTVESGLKLNGTGDLVTVKKDKTVTLQGVNIGEYGKLTTTGAGAVVGAIAGNGGKFGALNVAAGDLTVKGAAALQNLTVAADSALVMGKAAETATAVGDLEVKDYALVLGTLTAGKVTLGEADVFGTLTADKLDATDVVLVGSDEEDVAGKLVVNELASGTVFADSAWKDGHGLTLNDASQVAIGSIVGVDSTVMAGQGSLVALGTTDLDVAAKAVAAAGHAVLGPNEGQMRSAIYVDGGKTYDEATDTTSYEKINGNVIASGWNEAKFEDAETNNQVPANVQVLENNLMVVDMNTIDKTGANAVFVKDVTNNGTIYLADAEFGDKVMFTEADYTQGTTGAITFNGDRLMSAALKDKVHTIAFDDAKVASYEGLETLPLVTAMYEGKAQNGASTSAKFNNWLMSSGNGLDREEVIAIGNDAAKLGATSAVASVTMDAISAFNDSVAARTNVLAQRAEGVTVWADVMGGHYEAKELMDGQGYKSDVYGGVLGVDSVVSGYTLGAAFTVATADTDSTNTLAVSSTDSDFVGFSVYGAKAFGQFNLAADLGYMKGSNDVSVNAYNIGDFSADTDAFTLGLRGDVLVDAGSFKVVPHAGLRFTHLTTDDFESAYTTKIDSMNIFQMPVGVTVTGNVEAAGWNVAPLLDLSVVPAFGDTDADMTLGINGVAATSALSTQVIDSNLFQMKLGVSAQKDAFTFGLNYKLGAGSDNRVNNTFNATVGYAF